MRALVAAVALLALAAPAAATRDPEWPLQVGAVRVRLPDAWRVTTGDPRVVVALVDTGLTPTPDTAANIVPGWDFVDGDARPLDTWGHGSQVASVVGAIGDNDTGIAGVCWRCSLMPIRVAARRSVSQADIARGIRYGVDHGARIVDVSFAAAPPVAPELAAAVAYAKAHGVLLVAPAGNTGGTGASYPAALPGVLAVGATDVRDALYPWSVHGSWVAVAAPGCQVVVDPRVGPATICGTSFAQAVVAGVAALLLSAVPSLSADHLTEALERSAVPVRGIAYGRIDAAAALAAVGAAAPTPPPAPAPGPSERDVRLQTGHLTAARAVAVAVKKGTLEAQLVSPAAPRCTLAIRSARFAALALPADQTVLSVAAPVPAGRYRIVIRCARPRSAPYTLTIGAAFAGSSGTSR